MGDWFSELCSGNAPKINNWLAEFAKRLGLGSLTVAGAGTRLDPWRVPLSVDDTDFLSKLNLTLAVESEVRMPHPSEIKENWNWLHRSSPVMWQEQPITPANDRARFAQNGIEAHEGWLKFSGGVGEGKK